MGDDDDAGPRPASAVLALLDGGVEGLQMGPATSPRVLPALLAHRLIAHPLFFFFLFLFFVRFGEESVSSPS